ncbi:alpha/beta hydrolase [Aeromicrobium sp. YIM 150415]|uniref:alpha/beta hydrolase n=1 Tax=Aeromicrobium sp. YIM 150415 TaxID=2803912 RepID=UPI001965D2C8|nr:alpha/beta hydrolase [Aeromicrobium sp. YIM 150415]MBM9465600.1 alpha/beta hydrolase [Aeromicrobium sp. YIM 150415]
MSVDWTTDLLGEPYERHVIELGDDPDGEGTITATLVRRAFTGSPRAAVIYVHGFTDYFFQTAMAEFYADRGVAFYSLDLRKCGRSLRDGHTAHYVSDLAYYDAELDESLRIVREETGLPVYLAAHSTGGLIVPLWLHRMRRGTGSGDTGIAGIMLNSPWFDLQGAPWMRGVGTQAIRLAARVRPGLVLKLPEAEAYGSSLHTSRGGEWDYELAWKPLGGFPVTVGWLSAVRRGQARLHRGLDIGVPSLVLRSDRSRIVSRYSEEVETADAVLDVRQIARWAGCLGDEVTSVPIPGARHDVFLSRKEARDHAYEVLGDWLDRHLP